MVVGSPPVKPSNTPPSAKSPNTSSSASPNGSPKSPSPTSTAHARLPQTAVTKFFSILPTLQLHHHHHTSDAHHNYRVKYHPINYFHRAGRSKIKPIRDTLLFVQLILRTGVYFAPLRIFLPIASVFFLGFLGSLWYDVFIGQDLTDTTLILLSPSFRWPSLHY